MSARSVAFVPHIDIEPFRTGSEHDKRRVAREVGRACEEIGVHPASRRQSRAR